jgi:curli biogenesis system outer membrane secretion channel CsgG
MFGQVQDVTLTADVVKLNAMASGIKIDTKRLQTALDVVCTGIIPKFKKDSRIAVLGMSSANEDMSAFMVSALEYELVKAGRFTVVDRGELDKIRAEQRLHMGGEVSDESAVSIGKLIGANLVITGSVIANRVTVKALDVKTAEILAMGIADL